MLEFCEEDSAAFDEVMAVLKQHNGLQNIRPMEETVISFCGMKIYPIRRCVCFNNKEIYLTAKEFNIFYLLFMNREQVLTYEQIYQNVWHGPPDGRVSTTISYHILNLRKKLGMVQGFSIRCVREVGYCLELAELELAETEGKSE